MAPVTLFLVVGAAFARCLFAKPIWDDPFLTVRNPHLTTWRGVFELLTTDIWSSSALDVRSNYYRPVASLTFALNRALAGNSSAAYHAGNVLLHAGSAVLLFLLIVRRRIAAPSRAWASVLFVATMPLVAESVSFLGGRYDLVATVFALVALLANGHGRRIWATPAAAALSMLSKEPFVLIALLVVGDDVLLLRRRLRDELRKYALLALACFGYLGLRHAAGVAEPGLLVAHTPVDLVRAYVFAWRTFVPLVFHPHTLSMFHTYEPPAVLACVVVLGVLGAALTAAFVPMGKLRASVPRAAVAFGCAWTVVTLVPSSLAAPTLWIIGDRYAYFPLLGVALACAGGMELLASRLRFGSAAPLVAVVLAVAQLPRLESRLAELRNEDALFDSTLARDPDNFTVLTLRGNLLASRRHYAEAEASFAHARKVAPFTGDADTGLCFVHLRERRYATAEADCRRALQGSPNNPRAWVDLASALVDEDRPAEAIDAATQALRVNSGYAEAHVVRALGYLELGRRAAAQSDLDAALALDPTNAKAHLLLARMAHYAEDHSN